MLDIVNEILSLEHTRSGKRHVMTYSMLELLSAAIARNINAIEQKQQSLQVELPDDFSPMQGDSRQLCEAVSNLLSNAQKYAPENGTLALRLRQQNGYARIEVQDTGYGISKEAQENLFQEFYRVRTEQTAHINGTGQRLSLVKAIVTSHQGRMWVESDTGQGRTFFIELPNMDNGEGPAIVYEE